jgi:hypothetical protein
MRRWVVLVVVASALLVVVPASAYEQRSGTVSFGVQGHLSGLLSGKGEFFEAFELRNGLDGVGPGLSIRFRISIDRASAIGASFEASDFERTLPSGEVAAFETAARDTADKVHATVVTADYYRYFWRKGKDTPYLVVNAGYYRPEIRFGEKATRFPGSNLMLGGGIGAEHFFSRSVSLDVSFRVFGLFHDEGPSVSSQLAIGITFYNLGGRRQAP